MAADVCSEISNLVSSPRISFSHDLKKPETAQIDDYLRQSDLSLCDPNFDFHFCISKSFNHELSPADELFSNGKILPIQIKNKKKPNHSQQPITKIPTSPNNPRTEEIKKKRLKELLSSNFDDEELKPSQKSFWQFKRSTSLNFGSGQSKSVIRSLQFLSRSNSTGSALNPKQNEASKDYQKRHWFKQVPGAFSRSFSSSLGHNSYYYPYNSSKRPPLKKNCRSYGYGDGVRVSPVLNIPHNCIAIGTASLLGFGSFFCNGKAKKKEK
ncbi:uncharacterized protein LOC130766117 [Actinidia eriantha]|uniref:uncharacterized protein LOC130766117 n=1 Tax=Actinidia eriantha TaxID=165200 RepID=UPI0025906616|nr:uncharacterized protein LOC130766117 [Actinidia eriantha]